MVRLRATDRDDKPVAFLDDVFGILARVLVHDTFDFSLVVGVVLVGELCRNPGVVFRQSSNDGRAVSRRGHMEYVAVYVGHHGHGTGQGYRQSLHLHIGLALLVGVYGQPGNSFHVYGFFSILCQYSFGLFSGFSEGKYFVF